MDLDFTRLGIQIIVAIACAGVANTLIPRRIPGKLVGLVFIGLIGVWLGEWLMTYFDQTYDLTHPSLHWNIQQVKLIPAILGCMIVMFLMKIFLQWGRYER